MRAESRRLSLLYAMGSLAPPQVTPQRSNSKIKPSTDTMKTTFATQLTLVCLLLVATPPRVFAQGTTFTYQGRLTAGGTNFSGTGFFKFALVTGTNAVYTTRWSNDGTSSAGSEPLAAVSVPVNAGLFAVVLGNTALANMTAIDPAIFAQPALQLRIWFNDGVHGFAALDPPQSLTPAPYAIFASSANAAGLTGTIPAATLGGIYSNAVTLTNAANIFAGNGIGLTNVNAAKLGGYAADRFWKLGGNNVAPGQFLGSTNNQPVELWVNNTRALRLEPTLNDATHSNIINVVNGSPANTIAPGVYGSVIAGGGAGTYLGSAGTNNVSAHLSFLGGGFYNSIQTNADHSVLGGGAWNAIQNDAADCVLGGGQGNSIQANAGGSFLGGGYGNSIQTNAWDSVLGGGTQNWILADAGFAVLWGGAYNSIGTNAAYSVIGGGGYNSIEPNAGWSFLGGGGWNVIQDAASFLGGGYENSIAVGAGLSFLGGGDLNSIATNAGNSFLGGGESNSIGTNAYRSFLGGGWGNSIQAGADHAVLGGGFLNANGGSYSVVPGGRQNYAGGQYSFAAGYNAKATNYGAFVWSDGTGFETSSTTSNQFVARASGGYVLYSSTGSAGVSLAVGSGAWTSLSDRNAKDNFAPVDAQSVLAKVAALPLNTWNYKSQPASVRHIGPTAQDFKAAFGLGETDTGISTVDAEGVALAAIQGLNQKLAEELTRRDAEIAELKRCVERLEQLINSAEIRDPAMAATLPLTRVR